MKDSTRILIIICQCGDCGLKPDNWQFSSTLPIASKRQLALTVPEKPANDKKRKLTALELVQTLSVTELAEVSAAIYTIHNGPEVDATTSSDDVQEAIQALISFNRRLIKRNSYARLHWPK
jgi:hypothetical protein